MKQKKGKKAIKKNTDLFYTKNWFILTALLVFTFIVFYNSLHNDFVEWDDNEYVYQNEDIRSISPSSLAHLFTRPYVGMYSPLAMVTYAFDYQIWGNNPYGYHLTNLLFHLANVILAFFLFYRLTQKKAIATIVALFFAIHPMHVESVSWIAERKDVVYTFFYLMTLLLYIKYCTTKSIKYLWIAVGSFVLSCFSKSAAVTLPVLLLLFDYFLHRFDINKEEVKEYLFIPLSWWKIGLEKLPFFVVSASFAIVSMYTQADAISDFSGIGIWKHALIVIYASVYYIIAFLIPINLNYLHPFTFNLTWEYYAAPAVWIVLLLIFIFAKSYRRALIFGLGFYLITIGLTLHIFPVGMAVVSERYAYVPYIGLAFILGVIYYKVNPKWRFIPVILLTIGSLILGYLSWERNKVWKNTYELSDDGIKKCPWNFSAYFMRGNAWLFGMGCEENIEKAIIDYSQSIRIQPNMLSFMNRGFARAKFNDYTGAFKDLNRSIEMGLTATARKDKESAYRCYFYKADLLDHFGSLDSALVNYEIALKHHPGDTTIINSIKRTKEKMRESTSKPDFDKLMQAAQDDIFRQDFQSALVNVNNALVLEPHKPSVYFLRAEIYFHAHEYELALEDMNIAILMNPNNAEYFYNRGNLHLLLEQRALACQDFRESLRLGKQEAFLPIYELCGNK